MLQKRAGLIKFAGKDATVIGSDVLPGQKAPEFTVQALDWSVFKGINRTRGKVRIICSLPSLSTSVCDRETRRFNQEAANLSEDIVVMAISTDLPFTQKNWCAAAGIDKVVVLSDHLRCIFGTGYGLLIKEGRILRRAVFVVNRRGIVVYAAYMSSLGEEPNYPEVLEAARQALEE